MLSRLDWLNTLHKICRPRSQLVWWSDDPPGSLGTSLKLYSFANCTATCCIWYLLIRFAANCDAEEILGVETPEDFSADPLGVETRLFRALWEAQDPDRFRNSLEVGMESMESRSNIFSVSFLNLRANWWKADRFWDLCVRVAFVFGRWSVRLLLSLSLSLSLHISMQQIRTSRWPCWGTKKIAAESFLEAMQALLHLRTKRIICCDRSCLWSIAPWTTRCDFERLAWQLCWFWKPGAGRMYRAKESCVNLQ